MRLEPTALARAVATLDQLGMLRGTPTMSEYRLTESGGMRLHLRAAMTSHQADALHRAGRAAWDIGSLTGHNMKPGDVPDPSIAAGDDAAVLVAISRIAEWTEHGGAFSDGMSMARSISEREGVQRIAGLPQWIESLEDGDVGVRRRTALRHLCASLGMADPYDHPVALDGLWTEHHVEGTVVSVTEDKAGWSDVIVDQTDNRRERFRWKSDERICWAWDRSSWDRPRRGERLRLEYAGRTPEHRGYVSRIRNLEEYEEGRRRRALVDLMSRPIPEPLYGDGSRVRPRDRVVIVASCLEVSSGTEGRVTSLCGELAMVRFEGRRRPVPCYPGSLERIVKERTLPIAA